MYKAFSNHILFAFVVFSVQNTLANEIQISKVSRFKNENLIFFQIETNDPSTISGFYIHRKERRGSFQKITRIPLSADSKFYKDKSGSPDAEYKIEAIKFDGTTIISSLSTVTESFDSVSPPAEQKIFNTDKGVLLKFKNQPETMANIYFRKGIDGSFIKVNQKPVKENEFLHKPPVKNKRLYYYLTGIKGKDESRPGDIMNIHPENDNNQRQNEVTMANEDALPAIVNNLKGSYVNTYVILYWDSLMSPNIKEYKIYRSGIKEGPYTFDGKVSAKETKFYSLKVPLSTTVFYKVAAVNNNDVEGNHSEVLTIKTPNPRPTPPSGVTAKQKGGNKVSIEWNGFDEPNLKAFRVYYTFDGKNWLSQNVKKQNFSTELTIKAKSSTIEIYIVSVNDFDEISERSKQIKLDLIEY